MKLCRALERIGCIKMDSKQRQLNRQTKDDFRNNSAHIDSVGPVEEHLTGVTRTEGGISTPALRFADGKLLKRIFHRSDKVHKFNRVPDMRIAPSIHYLIVPLFYHHHRAGKRVTTHIRVQVFDDTPSFHLLDMTLDDFVKCCPLGMSPAVKSVRGSR